jgi:uncharacterized membrane protein
MIGAVENAPTPPGGPREADPTHGGSSGRGARALAGIGLGTVLLCLVATLGIGAAAKGPCASGDWADGRQYRRLCYSDIVPLLATEQMQRGSRLPYVDPCRASKENCDEYPVLSMYAMRVAAWITPMDDAGAVSFQGFFVVNAAILAVAALATTVALYLMVGQRALYFALAPTLLIYGFVNWDLLAVAFATLATLALLNRREVASGISLAAGASAKLYPALLLIPFALERLRERRPVAAVHLVWAALAAWLAINLPFAALGFSGWSEFFRFNSQRPPDWDSLWYVACDRIPGLSGACEATLAINVLSLALFAGLALLVWRLKMSRAPEFPRWTFGFPLLVLFLLTSKVYSPQYGLWLLPWFALAVPGLRRFAAFEAADIAVFVTRFAFFGQMSRDIGGWVDAFTIGWFQIALLVRAGVLVWCLAGWVTGNEPALVSPAPPPRAAEPPDAARAFA